jgi:phosphomannomutase/phosphoglucomutase
MKETNALLAGEMSGHFFFADRFFGFDDATYAGARLMQLLAEQGKPLSCLLNDVPHRVSTPEIRIPCPDDKKFDVVEQAKTHFSAQDYQMIEIDGMRLVLDNGWALLRASNTQPALTLRYEAINEIVLATLREKLEGWVNQHLEAYE